MKYVKDHDIAREIVQEAFVSLWDKRDTIELGRSPEAYLGTTVRNRCFNYLRDNKKYVVDMLDIERLGETHAYNEQDHLIESELKERIDEAINSLPNKCRKIFLMSRIENKKYQKIADECKISIKTVEVQMSKALKIMRDKLSEYI